MFSPASMSSVEHRASPWFEISTEGSWFYYAWTGKALIVIAPGITQRIYIWKITIQASADTKQNDNT